MTSSRPTVLKYFNIARRKRWYFIVLKSWYCVFKWLNQIKPTMLLSNCEKQIFILYLKQPLKHYQRFLKIPDLEFCFQLIFLVVKCAFSTLEHKTLKFLRFTSVSISAIHQQVFFLKSSNACACYFFQY